MAHVNGLLLIDAPASALNNAGEVIGNRNTNMVAVKHIRISEQKAYPYVSAQAFRYWLRNTLETNEEIEWVPAPIFRDNKIAFTDGNPLTYWDDDLFGYMRTQSKKANAKNENNRVNETPTSETITRVSPFRVSTLVGISSTRLVDDFGVMTRHEGNPVPFEHQFYRSTLRGYVSLDLTSAGTFWAIDRTGYKNLDNQRVEEAEKLGLEKIILNGKEVYRLPNSERAKRTSSLFNGIAFLDGGAKQALHYTDVTPSFTMFAVTKGSNQLFNRVIDAKYGEPTIHVGALKEVLTVYANQILSPLYIGLPYGYMDSEREKLIDILADLKNKNILQEYSIDHPVESLLKISKDILNEDNWNWLE